MPPRTFGRNRTFRAGLKVILSLIPSGFTLGSNESAGRLQPWRTVAAGSIRDEHHPLGRRGVGAGADGRLGRLRLGRRTPVPPPYHYAKYRHVVRHMRHVHRWGYGPRYGYSYGAGYQVPAIYGDPVYDTIWSDPVVTRVYDD
jgi:hypothetical protein